MAANADAATFDQLHAIAKSARNVTEIRRYYGALTSVRDPNLAVRTMQIALSSEIPPQAAQLRFRLISQASGYNPDLSWQFMKKNYDELLRPFGPLAGGYAAQTLLETYWRGAPLDQIKTFVSAKVPTEMSPFIAKGLERAQFDVAERQTLDAAADTYVATQGLNNAQQAK